jgi:hypothetical protein
MTKITNFLRFCERYFGRLLMSAKSAKAIDPSEKMIVNQGLSVKK